MAASAEATEGLDANFDFTKITDSLLETICVQLENIADLQNVRQVTSTLRQPAADCVGTLLADIGDGALPATAWDVYRRATVLVVQPLYDRYAVDFSMMRTSDLSLAEYKPRLKELRAQIQNLVDTLAALPDRITSVISSDGEDHAHLPTTPEQATAITQAIIDSACAHALESLQLQFCMNTDAADALLEGLTALKNISLALGTVDPEDSYGNGKIPWAPKLPTSLNSLCLHHPSVCSPFKIDTSALAAATGLQSLALCGKLELVKAAELTRLTSLTSLELDRKPGELSSAAMWDILSKLPQLHQLVMQEAQLEMQQPGQWCLQELTHFWAQQLVLQVPDERLQGCLSEALPCVSHLVVESTSDGLELLRGLQGHHCVESLRLADYGPSGRLELAAVGPALSSMRQLTQLDFWSKHVSNARAVLAAAAGCAELRDLKLVSSCSMAAARGLAIGAAGGGHGVLDLGLLAAGACQQLESVYVKGLACSVGALGRLLQGGLSKLRCVTLGSRYQPWRLLLQDEGQLQQAVMGGKPAAEALLLAQQFAESAELVEGLVAAAAAAAARAAAAAAEVLGPAAMAAAAAAAAEEVEVDDEGGLEAAQQIVQVLGARLSGFGAGAHLLQPQEVDVLLARLGAALQSRLKLGARLRRERAVRLCVEMVARGCELNVFL